MAVLEPLVERIRRVPPFAIDATLAAAILLAGIIDLAVLTHPSDIPRGFHDGVLPYLLMAGWTIPVAFRRRSPMASYIVSRVFVIIGLILWTIDGLTVMFTISAVVLVFSLAEQCSSAVAFAGLMAENALNVVFVLFIYRNAIDSSAFALFQPLFYFPVLLGLVFFAGRATRRRRRLTDDLRSLNSELGEEQARLTREAVSAERRRIARELQALVLRGVEDATGLVGAASKELASDPLRATQTIAAIEATGRGTLVEMGRMLSMIETSEDDSPSPVGRPTAGANA